MCEMVTPSAMCVCIEVNEDKPLLALLFRSFSSPSVMAEGNWRWEKLFRKIWGVNVEVQFPVLLHEDVVFMCSKNRFSSI